MNDRKKNGSYYTPANIADFVIRYLLPELPHDLCSINFLEPSVGDGVFVKSLLKELAIFPHQLSVNVTTVERDITESAKVESFLKKQTGTAITYECITDDFLDAQSHLTKKYDLICGNPPYIHKKYLTKDQISRCLDINLSTNLPPSISNIWTAFVLRSAQLLSDVGIMAFVLPAEILQVKYAYAVKQFLYSCFERVEFFNFRELIFDAKGQGTVLVIGFKKSCNEKGVFFTTIDNIRSLVDRSFTLNKQSISGTNAIAVKEMHFDLPQDDLALLYRIKQSLRLVQHYADSKPGIVTAANNFFIVNESRLQEYQLEQYGRPIIQKGSFVNGKINFTTQDFENLQQAGVPTYLLDFNQKAGLENIVLDYLEIGESKDIHLRHKCSLRTRWYDIPNIATPPDAFFFKRCHRYPKLILNSAQILVTDSAYKIKLKPNFDLNSFVFAFYNSLTLAFAELEGRHYGGGVLELTPLEFKRLPLPYLTVDAQAFTDYAIRFEQKRVIEEILIWNDNSILSQIPGIDNQVIASIQRIRHQLVAKRFRTELNSTSTGAKFINE